MIHRQANKTSRPILLAVLSAFSLLAYLAASHLVYRIGFPLDDAWIHQTYARNLALNGEWAFLRGLPSAGSTAPLWSALLAVGFWIGAGPYIWSYLIGWLLLFSTAWTGTETFRLLIPRHSAWAVWAGVLLAFEWHLVWAAGSGMETLASGLIALLVLTRLIAGTGSWVLTGCLIGVSAWIRPDGITLLGPAVFVLFLDRSHRSRLLRSAGELSLGFLLVFAPYLIFNRVLAGAWWPNTFFAKQAEYAVLRDLPLTTRILQQVSLPLVGVGVVLAPGFLLTLSRALKQRRWGVFAAILWVAGYLVLYALRLPVTYQHGRYVMPVMPAFFLLGASGLAGWVLETDVQVLWRRVLAKAWPLAGGLILAIFFALGMRAYALDVAFIETEMVKTAGWVAEYTEPDALVAAHDIGALGYFSDRPLLDLAGLISPEAIPILRDEAALQALLTEKGADYLVTFPGWYERLTDRAELVYQTGSRFGPLLGGENMHVYRWGKPQP